MPLPPIKGFIENTMLDWEGRISAALFLPGCNFRCPYCHAGHLVSDAALLESIPIERVMASLMRNRDWIDGIVVSGGEPTLHEGLRELVELFRDAGLPVKLDTNGARPGVLRELVGAGLVEHVAMDVKAPLDDRYRETVGVDVDLDKVRASIGLLMEGDVSHEFRTTVCPVHTNAEDIEDLARDIEGAEVLFLQKFRPVNCLDESLNEVKPYNDEEMREFAERAARHVRRCVVRGDTASEVKGAR